MIGEVLKNNYFLTSLKNLMKIWWRFDELLNETLQSFCWNYDELRTFDKTCAVLLSQKYDSNRQKLNTVHDKIKSNFLGSLSTSNQTQTFHLQQYSYQISFPQHLSINFIQSFSLSIFMNHQQTPTKAVIPPSKTKNTVQAPRNLRLIDD